MARMSPEERRTAIVAATRTVMAREGIAGTTVRDVAAELGTSSGLIHHYVSSMDDLLAEAFAQAADEDLRATVAAMDGAPNAVTSIARFIGSYGRGDGSEGVQLWLDAWAEAARRPALRRTSQQLNEQWQRVLADALAEGHRRGEFTCANPDAVGWRLLSLLDGLALQVVAHPGSITPAQAVAWTRRTAELELGLPTGALDHE